jgi:hypothetical protein
MRERSSSRRFRRNARRAVSRGVAPLEAAAGFAIVGSVLAVAIPAFVRDLHASHFTEATEGLAAIGEGAVAYAAGRPVDQAFPVSAPLTPPRPPRGIRSVDAPLLWQTPTWQSLHFPPPRGSGRAFGEGEPHAFAFCFDSALSPTRSVFAAHAHGDLDGNGVMSTFEIHGRDMDGDPAGATVDPGMYVQGALE